MQGEELFSQIEILIIINLIINWISKQDIESVHLQARKILIVVTMYNGFLILESDKNR